MKTEYWTLLVSIFALLASIGIPVWQARNAEEQTRAVRRGLLLQTILAAKTTTFVSLHELLYLLQKYGSRMDEQQRNSLAAMHPRMRAHYSELEQLHDTWTNFNDGASLAEIETTLANINAVAAEGTETAQLIENGRKSYEDI
jgi:hypothetical protein